jgi:hypothetical protein
MKPKSFYTNPFCALASILDDQDDNQDGYFHSTKFLQSKYEKANILDVANCQVHLMVAQRDDLHTLLFAQQTKLFSGNLGKYPFKKMDLELLPDARPIHAKPYPIPHVQLEVFHAQLEHLVGLGILYCVGGTEWASPTFIIPNNDICVHWISDFCELNKVILCKIYPLPLIQEILKK